MRWAIGTSLGFLLVLGGLVLFRDSFFKAYVVRTLSVRTGLRAEIAELRTSLGKSAVSLHGLRLFDGPEFGGGVFLSIPELVVELDSEAAGAGRLKFRKLLLDLAEVNVVRSTEGRNNIDQLDRAFTPRQAGAAHPKGMNSSIVFDGIDYMKLSIGDVQYIDLRRPRRSRKIEVAVRDEIVRDIKTEEELQSWAGAFLFRVFLQEAMKRSGETHQATDDGAAAEESSTVPALPPSP